MADPKAAQVIATAYEKPELGASDVDRVVTALEEWARPPADGG